MSCFKTNGTISEIPLSASSMINWWSDRRSIAHQGAETCSSQADRLPVIRTCTEGRDFPLVLFWAVPARIRRLPLSCVAWLAPLLGATEQVKPTSARNHANQQMALLKPHPSAANGKQRALPHFLSHHFLPALASAPRPRRLDLAYLPGPLTRDSAQIRLQGSVPACSLSRSHGR